MVVHIQSLSLLLPSDYSSASFDAGERKVGVMKGKAADAVPERAPWDVAVDLHRRNLFVLVAERTGREVRHQRLPHSETGIAQILALLGPGDRVVLEATGGAHALARRLESKGSQVLLADPQETRLVGMRGKKTDYRDCRALLRHLRAGELATVWRPDVPTQELRHLSRERQSYNQMIVRLKNRIKALLREEGLFTPDGLWSSAGARWLEQQALTVATRRIVVREWAVLQVLQAYKEQQEEELARRCVTSEPAQRLLQIVGFGAAAAVLLLAELGDCERFTSGKQVASYAGLNPRVHQSDERSTEGPISKAGRAPLRWLMIEVAWVHVAQGGPEADHYHRLVARGKKPQVAIVALARRLLVLAYTLLKRKENYREVEPARYLAKLARVGAKSRRAQGEAVDPEEASPAKEGEGGEPRRLISGREWARERFRCFISEELPAFPASGRSKRQATDPGGSAPRTDNSGKRIRKELLDATT
jgi:transposase